MFDTKTWALLEYGPFDTPEFLGSWPEILRKSAVTLVKIIVITIIVILSILLFGRFFV